MTTGGAAVVSGRSRLANVGAASRLGNDFRF